MQEYIIPFHINTICPLACPFCYLEGMAGKEVTHDGIDTLLSLGQVTYICIGKEPTNSPEMLAYFLRQTRERGFRSGFITNGVLLDRFLARYPDVRPNVIDITYHKGDDGKWKEDLVRVGALRAREQCADLSVLFVLHVGNRRYLPDAIRFAEDVGADMCVVSPMIPTLRAETYSDTLHFPPLDEFFGMLSDSPAFMASSITCTAIDDYHFLEAREEPWSPEHVLDLARQRGIGEKVVALGDPFMAEHPVMDVDVMGAVAEALHPIARLNTNAAVSARFPRVTIVGRSLQQVYEELCDQMTTVDILAMLRV